MTYYGISINTYQFMDLTICTQILGDFQFSNTALYSVLAHSTRKCDVLEKTDEIR